MRTFLASAFALLAFTLFARQSAASQVRGSGLQPRHTLLNVRGASAPEGQASPLLWKAVTNSFLRVNDQGFKEWGIFQVEKKDPRYLVQLGARFLLVDAEQKQVFELAPDKIERSGSDVLWDPAHIPSRPMVTSDWLVRDVGLAYRIKMRLDAEDRTLDLQLTHPVGRP